jgi:hypothetical protein
MTNLEKELLIGIAELVLIEKDCACKLFSPAAGTLARANVAVCYKCEMLEVIKKLKEERKI